MIRHFARAGALAALAFASPAAGQQLRVAYYGETITHYGLKAAYEHPLLSRVKDGNNARKELVVAPGLAVYRHPHNHWGVVVSPELLYRRTGARGGLLEAGVAPSYFRYFLAGTTYEVNPQGGLEQVPLAGGNAFLPTVFVGIGRDQRVHPPGTWAWYGRLLLSQQYPYNLSSLTRFAVEAGIIKNLKTR